MPREIAALLDLKEPGGGRRVILKAVERMLAGVEAIAAGFDLAFDAVGLADLELETPASQIAIEPLKGRDLDLSGGSGLIGSLVSARPCHDHAASAGRKPARRLRAAQASRRPER